MEESRKWNFLFVSATFYPTALKSGFHRETCGLCLVPLESIKEVLCHIDPSRASLSHGSERGPKVVRHVNFFYVA